MTDIAPGLLFKEWAEFRASLVKEYFEDVRALVKRVKPDVWFMDYVGSWYPDYAPLGANWASRDFEARYE